jgi:dienelactone hydrolase
MCVAAADDLAVLPPPQQATLQSSMVYRHLQRLAEAAIERRLAAYEQTKSPEQVRAWQQTRREFFLRQLGDFPQRTPLNAKTVGTFQKEGYRIEKVIYESQPNHHVTALLYLPSCKPPCPGVLIPCGHNSNGKAAERGQRAAILLAQNGIASLCYDPLGQGERYQLLSRDAAAESPQATLARRGRSAPIPGNPPFNPVEEHNLIGIGSVLLGINTATYRVYDGMRSLDYLASRPEIDPKRLGCTGASGGGTLTSYLMALDDRIVCAAPACYLTTFRRLLAQAGPQDAEQVIFGQLAFGLDQADYVLMAAPKPIFLGAAARDVTFDIAGTWDIFREAKRFYARFGLPERVTMVDADEPHAFSLPLREGTVRWMRRWLLGIDDAVTEVEAPVLTDAQAQCTPGGQVLFLPGERSVFDLNRQREEALAGKRKTFWATTPTARALQAVRELAGVRRLTELPESVHRRLGLVQRRGYLIEKLVLEPEPGIQLPALAFVPPTAVDDAYLYVDGAGKQADTGPGGPIEALVAQGHLVLAVDLRGMGETELRGKRGGYWLKDQEASLAYLLGKSLVGMRAEDVLVCARFLTGYRGQGRACRVHLVARGEAGVPALHAAALEPELFKSVRLRRALASWADVVRISAPLGLWCSTVHGALKTYDLPDLVQTLSPEKIVVEEPVDALGRTIDIR